MSSRHILTVWCVVALMPCFMAQPLTAATFGEFVYEDGATITITGHTQYTTGPVVIPQTINGKTVGRIGPYAFKFNSLSSVTIPEGVVSIGEGAFRQCMELTSVSLPTTLARIETRAFEQCAKLRNLTLPAGLTTIQGYTFSYCRDLQKMAIPEGVTDIKEYAFVECRGLTDMSLPSTVRSIGQGAFARCRSLQRVRIPSGLSLIQKYAFADCSGLKSVSMAEGVTRIGLFAFLRCSSLKKLTIPASMTRIGHGAFHGCEELTGATFTGDAPVMEDDVFADTSAAFKVYFPKGRAGFTTPEWHGYPAVAISPNPEISLQQPVGTELADGTAKKSFGTVKLGSSSKARTFTIRNLGASELLGLAITKNGNHSGDYIITAPSKTTLPPGTATTFKVTFKPKATGTREAVIHISSNDNNENPFDIMLSGMGVK